MPEAFGYAAGSLHQSVFMLGGLIVEPAGMAKNLGLTHGLIVAEAVMMGLAPVMGRNEAHDLVYDACQEALKHHRPSGRCSSRNARGRRTLSAKTRCGH